MDYATSLSIGGKKVSNTSPTFFIADIAANHDGDLQRAIELIHLVAEAGADAAKFQHFRAETIVSDTGFKSLGGQQSHQAGWKKSVFEVYRDASLNADWTPRLAEACNQAGIAFFSSPYAFDLVDAIDPYVPAYKVGSGDITWIEIIEYMAAKNKPCILATGASTLDDVQRAVSAALRINPQLALLQCNTNYTANVENYHHIQLNVLNTYRAMYPNMILGLSDHTLGHATVLGAVALGASIIEKHFTDNIKRNGPDHAFSMCPRSWREMVDRTRELEAALGCGGVKKVEENELETVVLQRRALYLKNNLPAGAIISRDDLIVLRPCPESALPPYEINRVVGCRVTKPLNEGDALTWSDIA